MRYRKQGTRWQKRAAAVMAVLFFVLGARACVIERQEREAVPSTVWQQWECRVLRGTIGFLSPAMGYAWDMVEQEDAQAAPSIEALLLAEQTAVMLQTGQNSQNVQGQGELSHGEEEEQGAWKEDITLAPEDEDEVRLAVTERDADLLAEIDRENEAMRQQAQLLQSQQTQESAGEGQTAMEGETAVDGDTVQTVGQVLALPYTMEQLGSLQFLKETLYNVNKSTQVTADQLDAATFLAMDMKLEQPDSDGPKILIHHTHATEYFADSDEQDEATLIVGVGDYLEELLETRYGIEVLHDRTVYPYNEAYSRALTHVEQILAENPTIEVFIDLHRDAGGTQKYTVNIGGKETANLMFFNGLSRTQSGSIGYLPNENQQANLAFSFQMKMAGDSLYPGLCKRNYLKAYRYNLHVLPRAVIVEVGDNNNTLQEAKNAMEPLAQILNYVLTGKY